MHKFKILIVEDDFVIAHFLETLLQKAGYEVVGTANRIAKAKTLLTETQPDLALLDINLAEYDDGVELGHFLLKTDTIPFLYLTANNDAVTLERAKATRPQGFLVKPFKEQDVLSTIAIVLHNRSHQKIDPKRNPEPPTTDVPFRIREVIAFIHANTHRKIELQELIALTRWKKTIFSAHFKNHMNCTPYQFVLKTKIEKAATVIATSNQPLQEIAIDLGFESYTNFCAAFQKNYNCTPDNYRLKTRLETT